MAAGEKPHFEARISSLSAEMSASAALGRVPCAVTEMAGKGVVASPGPLSLGLGA